MFQKSVSGVVLAVAAALTVNGAASADNGHFTGDLRYSCEAVLCLATSTRPGECSPALSRYFSIRAKKLKDTVRLRANFLKICPMNGDNGSGNKGGGGNVTVPNPDQIAAGTVTLSDKDENEDEEEDLPGQYTWYTTSRVLSCTQAKALPAYSPWINQPNITGRITPDGYQLYHMGVLVAIAQGGYSNQPLYDGVHGEGRLVGWGYALEFQAIKKDKTGRVVDRTGWRTSKTGSCDIGNPESYKPPR